MLVEIGECVCVPSDSEAIEVEFGITWVIKA